LGQGIAGPTGELFSLARGLFLRFTRSAGGGVQRGDSGVVLFLRNPRGTKRDIQRAHLLGVAFLFRGGSAGKLNALLHQPLIFALGVREFLARGAATATTSTTWGRWRPKYFHPNHTSIARATKRFI
jgi:hypothetical protein